MPPERATLPQPLNWSNRIPPSRVRLLGGGALLSVALAVAGCGGSSSPGVARLSSAKGVSLASSAGAGSSPESTASRGQQIIAFARCMRSHGAPSYPDPKPGGGATVRLPVGSNPAAPAFEAAQTKCQKFMPGGGPPGSGPPPSAQTMAHWLKVSQCMRQHGVSAFPDPMTSVPVKSNSGSLPSNPSGQSVVADREGAILVIPGTIDMQSPGFLQAAAACGVALHNH